MKLSEVSLHDETSDGYLKFRLTEHNELLIEPNLDADYVLGPPSFSLTSDEARAIITLLKQFLHHKESQLCE